MNDSNSQYDNKISAYIHLKTNKFSYYKQIIQDVMLCVFNIKGVPRVKFSISGFNSRADIESKTSYTHGSNLQPFRSYEFLNYSKY